MTLNQAGESVWRWSPEHDAQGTFVTPFSNLPALAWARTIQPELVHLQRQTDLPAAGVVTQLIHEAWNPGGLTLSRLASEYHNYAGIKWASDGWQRAFGGRPVSLSTWEELDGNRVDLTDAFCAFPSWGSFLDAYAYLLTRPRYAGALAYSRQPLLWLHQVWSSGWATDSRYLGGLGHWMAAVWPDYADTLPAPDPRGRLVRIEDHAGRLLATGWLMDPDGPGPEPERLVNLTRELADSLGLTSHYTAGEPSVYRIGWPGSR